MKRDATSDRLEGPGSAGQRHGTTPAVSDAMENFTPLESALGGLLIGLASSAMLVLNGRIAGISGIAGGILRRVPGDTSWRVLFVAGLAVGGVAAYLVSPGAFAFEVDRSLGVLAVAGVIVGVGTQMGSGCTSGHGVCGLSRFSKRSLVAVGTFMSTAALTVYAVQQLFGGSL